MSECLKPTEVHDHGKLMLTFIMVWAYFNFSQWLIIWAGNLPDEIHVVLHARGLTVAGDWSGCPRDLPLRGPFAFLLSRRFKRTSDHTGLAGRAGSADAVRGFVLVH